MPACRPHGVALSWHVPDGLVSSRIARMAIHPKARSGGLGRAEGRSAGLAPTAQWPTPNDTLRAVAATPVEPGHRSGGNLSVGAIVDRSLGARSRRSSLERTAGVGLSDATAARAGARAAADRFGHLEFGPSTVTLTVSVLVAPKPSATVSSKSSRVGPSTPAMVISEFLSSRTTARPPV